MAYPSRIGSSYAGGTSSTLVITYPAGSASGDLIVLQIQHGRTANGAFDMSVNGPTWTVVQDSDESTASGLRCKTLWAFRGSETSVTMTASVGTSVNGNAAQCIAYTAATVDSGDPIGSSSSYSSVSAGTAVSPSILTTVNEVEVLNLSRFWATVPATPTSTVWDTATEFDDNSNAGVNHRIAAAAAYRQYSTAGTTVPAETATASRTVGARGNICLEVRPPSTFPFVRGLAEGFRDSNSTSNSVAAPSNAVTGDLLLAVVVTDSSGTHSTATSGWTQLFSTRNTSGDRYSMYAGVKGTAAEPLVVTGSTSVHGAYGMRAIGRWSGSVSDIQFAHATGNSTNPNPPSLTAVYGANSTLWVGVAVGVAGTTMPSAAPTGFSNFNSNRCNSSSTSTHVAYSTATKWDSSATLDPGTFTNATCQWGATTLLVAPVLNASVSSSDSAGATETGVVAATLASSDSAGATDTAAVAATLARSDSAGVAESARISVAVSDAAGATDIPVPIGHDMFGATETQSSTAVVAASDSAGITETISVANAVNASDSAGVTESISGIAMSVSDTAGASDGVVPVGHDQAGVTDTVSNVAVPVSDTAGATETASAAVNTAASDSAGAADSAALLVSVSDTAGVSETRSVTANVPVSDSAGATDTVRLAPAAQSDSAGAAESARLSPAAQHDSAGVSESAIVTVSVFASDTAGVTESQPTIMFAAVSDSFGWDDAVAYRLSDQLQGLPRVRIAEREDRIRAVTREPRMLKPGVDLREQVTSRESRRLKVPATVTTFDVEAGN